MVHQTDIQPIPKTDLKVKLGFDPLDAKEAMEFIEHPSAGGLSLFSGNVRDNNLDHKVDYLEYEGYEPMALKEMEKIIEEATEKWALLKVFVAHRLGKINIGESSVLIAVSSGHRPECFAACRFLIDELKARVPIWKKEFFQGGALWLENSEGKKWIS